MVCSHRGIATSQQVTKICLNVEIFFFLDLCSHKRAYHYWAESVTTNSKDAFLAVEAKNFTYFRNGALNLSILATMGINCSLKYIFVSSIDRTMNANTNSPFTIPVL